MPKAKLPYGAMSAIKQVKQMAADDMAKAYMPLAEACAITGMTEKKLLAFCATHTVQHHKYQNRWLIHQQELITAFRVHG